MAKISKYAQVLAEELQDNSLFRNWVAVRLVKCADGQYPNDFPAGLKAAMRGKFRTSGAGLLFDD